MEPKNLKVGQKYRIINNAEGGHELAVGYEFTATWVDHDNTIEEEGWWIWPSEVEEVRESPAQDLKDTNPKDAAATNRLPLDLVPSTLEAMVALAFAEGAAKYGAYNWRVAGVRASVYRAAMKRHFDKWWNGEDVDPKTGVPHLASVAAGAAIIMDSALAGKLTDDRPPKVPLGELIDSLEPKVANIREMFKDRNPHHHTALDK